MSDSDLWIWGRHPVLEALRAGLVRELVIASGRAPAAVLDDIRREAAKLKLAVRDVAPGDLERLVGATGTGGVAARVTEPPVVELRDLLAPRHAQVPLFLLVLDQIQDPHNLGALLRTAGAAGVDGVLLPDRRTAPLTATVAKTSAGAMSYVSIVRPGNLGQALTAVKRAGVWTVGLSQDAPGDLYGIDFTVPIAVVVGNEGSGLRRLTQERCDLLARIPMAGPLASLNATVAGSIAMYEVVRQRISAGLISVR